jgi:hypothetical protein
MKTTILVASTLLAAGTAMVLIAVHVPQKRSFHVDPQVAAGSWTIDINVPPCTGKVINSGSSPDGGPLELTCVNMPVATR